MCSDRDTCSPLLCEMKKNRIPQAQFILCSHLNKEHVVHTHVDTEKRLEGKLNQTYFRKAALRMVFMSLVIHIF